MAASYDDGRRRQARQRRLRLDECDSGLCRHNGASYDDNGIGLYRRKTTAAAEIDDDAIGGSISLVRGLKQQSTDDRGEETAMSDDNTTTDGGWGRRDTTISLNIGRGGTVVGA
jgi:hypothetical protein